MIEGKRRVLTTRTKCLDCFPFGSRTVGVRIEHKRQKEREWRAKKIADEGVDPIRARCRARKRFLVSLFGGCQLCGYMKSERNLSFHHLHDKDAKLSTRELHFDLRRLLPEMEKCVFVCHNCHGEIHDGLVPETLVQQKHLELLTCLRPFRGQSWGTVLPESSFGSVAQTMRAMQG